MNVSTPLFRIPLLGIAMVWLYILPSYATHLMGVDISYECLDSCNYRITHTTYYDCTGSLMISAGYVPLPSNNIPPPPNNSLTFLPANPACSLPIPITNWVVDTAFGYLDVTPVCPSITTGCQTTANPDVPGVVAVRYVRDYNFCNVNCDSMVVQWDDCCRNNTINSMTSPGSQSIWVENLVIDFVNAPCNSSPQFTELPVPYLCSGQSFTFNQGVFDPDGDSLVFSLGPCLDFTNAPVPYIGGAGYSAQQPLGNGWDVSIDSLTGDITMTPDPTGPTTIAVICVYVEEYRNGVKIGETVRDMQITVIDCQAIAGLNNTFPVVDSVTNLSAGNDKTGDFEMTVCACELVCFDIPAYDPDTAQNYELFWSRNLPGGYMTNPLNPSVITDTLNFASGDSLWGRFCWIPQEIGFYTTTFTIRDDGCPIFGQNQYSVKIRVVTCSLDPIVLTNRTDCYKVEFKGLPCGGGEDDVTYSWTGDAGLSSDSSLFEYDFGGPGTYTYTLTITDTAGQTASVTDSITLFNTATANAGLDKSLCSYQVGNVGTTQQLGYTYSWSSPQGVGWNGNPNPGGAQPEIIYINSSQNPVTVPYYLVAEDAIGCEANDTVRVTYEPVIPTDFFITNTVCLDEPTTIQYSAPLIPGATYNWSYDGAVGTQNGPGPHTLVWTTPGQKEVKLVVNANGCDSDTGRFVVEVFDKPSPDFLMPSQACQNQSASITYTGSADFLTANFNWDFDGGVATQTANGYDVIWITPGPKTVSLSVSENGCQSDQEIKVINVVPTPEAAFFVQDTVCVSDISQITYVGNNNAIANFDWDFNGATISSGSGIGPYQLSWATPGNKNVCLTVRDQGCQSPRICTPVYVSPAPNLSIANVPNQCFDGNSFNFTASGSSDTYFWDFGQGAFPRTSLSATPPAVSYSTPGSKTVKLVGTNNGCGGDTAFATFEVVEEPSADFVASSTLLCSSEAISFDYQGTVAGPTQTFNWDFDDNAIPATSSLSSPQNISYSSGGRKDVTLTVSYKGCIVSTTQQIDVKESPSVDAGDDKEYCEGDGGVELDGVITGGARPYFYQWTCDATGGCGIDSINTSTPLVNPNVANPTEQVTYYFSVTDAFGCESGMDSAVVTVKAKPKLDAGPDFAICPPAAKGITLLAGKAANNNAPDPIFYQWTPAAGLSNPNVLQPTARPDTTTIYTLTGTSANGCTSEATTVNPLTSVTVTVKPRPNVEAGVDTGICVGESIQLDGFASNAGPSYSYSWTPAVNMTNANTPSPEVTPAQTTTYFLEVFSGDCSAVDSVTITVDTKPTVSAGDDRDICKFEEIVLDGKADGDPNATLYTYEWSPATGLSDPNSATPTASPDVNTVYTVVASTNSGCESDPETISLTVLPTPEVDLLQGDTIVCAGEALELVAVHTYSGTVVPTEYSWTPTEEINPFQGDSTVTAYPTNSGYIEVTASSLGGKCTTTDRALVEVTPAITVDISADTNRICQGEALLLTANGGIGNPSFEWIPAAGLNSASSQTPTATPALTTNYQVVMTEGACKDTAEFLLDVTPTPQADYIADLDQGCGELTVSFTQRTADAQAYIWDFGDDSPLTNEANPVHTFEKPGNYTVSLTTVGENLCSTTSEKITVVVAPLPSADFDSDPMLNSELPLPEANVLFTDQSQDAVEWLWNFGDGGVSTSQNPMHTYSEEGVYTISLTITDKNGCVSTIEYGQFRVYEPSLYIPTVFTPNGDGSNDMFEVSYDGTKNYSLVVMDRWGRKVFESQNVNSMWDGKGPGGSALPEGTYYYALKIGEDLTKGNVTLLR
jgi:gliding motility-associated-like protein